MSQQRGSTSVPQPTPPPRPLYQQAAAERAEQQGRIREQSAKKTSKPKIRPERLALWITLGAGALLTLTAWLAGSPPLALVLGITFACAAQGLWRGAAEVAGLLVGTLAALLLAPALGRALEDIFQAVLGTTGLQNRMLAIVIMFLLILAIVTAGASYAAKRFTRDRAGWRRWNHFAGGGIGLVEGGLLGMAVLWVPLALEPVARARLAGGDENAAASGVIDFARSVRDSALGDIAERTSPVRGSAILTLAEDFAIVSRHQEAMAYFVDTPALRRIKEMPSVNAALERLKQDPELKAMFSENSAVSSSALFAIMRSVTVLEVLDTTTVIDDLTPMAGDVVDALAAAKKVALR